MKRARETERQTLKLELTWQRNIRVEGVLLSRLEKLNDFRGPKNSGLVGGLALVQAFVGRSDVVDLQHLAVFKDLNPEKLIR